jgi:CheY-like chemotaxis protein
MLSASVTAIGRISIPPLPRSSRFVLPKRWSQTFYWYQYQCINILSNLTRYVGCIECLDHRGRTRGEFALIYSGRILIVDDDSDMQNWLQAWLRPAGYETATAWDGEQALNALGESTFDLALVDYFMPRMDGLKVLEHIAERRIPVGPLLLTASHDPGLIVEAMRRGALDCVVKPTPAKNLLLVLEETLERHWAQQLGLSPLPCWRGHDLSMIGNASGVQRP